MASSEVDQKFLARLAKNVNDDNPFLSSKLYQVLGLSVMLSKKLFRARRLRKLDTTRDTPSLQLYHHILWLSREGLVITETYVIPMAATYAELKVLAHKLRASFYHIFVLFHNNPQATQASIPTLATESTTTTTSGTRPSKSSTKAEAVMKGKKPTSPGDSSISHLMAGGPVGTRPPPGLRIPTEHHKPTSSFLLPATNYIPLAKSCFEAASSLARDLLPGSHPIRLSVQMEYVAFIYDCLQDGDTSRRLAKLAITDVYRAQEGMDDDMFEDSSAMVAVLGSMAKRGVEREREREREPERERQRRRSSEQLDATSPTSKSPLRRSDSSMKKSIKGRGSGGRRGGRTAVEPSPGMSNPI